MNAPRLVRERRGSALMFVIIAMVLLAVLSLSAIMGTMHEFKAGRNMLSQQRALTIAEYGLNGQLENWTAARSALAVGGIDSSNVVVTAGDTAKVAVMRLNATTFLVSSLGRSSVGNGQLESQRQVSMLVRVAGSALMAGSVLSSLGEVEIGGSSSLTGKNTTPPGWLACASARDTFAISYNPKEKPDIKKPETQAVGGTYADPSLSDKNALTTFGTESWESLVARATIKASDKVKPSPVGSEKTCTYSASNWGEPSRAKGAVVGCQNYFPVIYSAGDLDLTSGSGQGLLIVDGRLRIRGNFVFAGVILVRDEFEAEGTMQLYGALVSRNEDGGDTKISGNASLNYSACAIDKAMGGQSVPSRSKHRSWVQLF
jgi:Tfp pilus assembly protein PilX